MKTETKAKIVSIVAIVIAVIIAVLLYLAKLYFISDLYTRIFAVVGIVLSGSALSRWLCGESLFTDKKKKK